MKGGYSRKSVLTGITSFLIVLFTMPLGHALMIFMEHVLSSTALHYAAFTMGAAGLVMVIIGVFAKGDTRQTLWGLFGGLLFWTGWVEFIYVYYAHRYEVQPLLNAAGEVVTKPEYLIMPSSFGFWVMFMLIYIFSIKSGCDFFTYLQKVFFRKSTTTIVVRPMTRHTSIVTFMELNLIMWTSYLVLLFCYDENFVGEHSPVTAIVAFGCLAGSFFMFKRLLKITQWGYAMRFSIATVVVFWTFVEVLGRWNIFHEIWVEPMAYTTEMITILLAFFVLLAFLFYQSAKKKNSHN
ncbi:MULTISPECIES: hypothetical protein [Bacteroides]|uniref:hypothetical protein n=1 Tax=Bacteroides TaxID=816 RepID=UPI00319E43F7